MKKIILLSCLMLFGSTSAFATVFACIVCGGGASCVAISAGSCSGVTVTPAAGSGCSGSCHMAFPANGQLVNKLNGTVQINKSLKAVGGN